MTILRLTGWRPGLRKVSLTKLLQEKANMSVSDAKHAVDVVLEGGEVRVEVPSGTDATALLASIRALGAECESVSGPAASPDRTPSG